jgi:hypothetical protein
VPKKTIKLRASEVLNWDYLVKISERSDVKIRNATKAIAAFAYDFTSTADEDRRDRMLADLLKNGTANVSRESAEDYIRFLARYLESEPNLVREFAKENGVRLKWNLV